MLNRLEEKPFVLNLERGGIAEKELIDECVWITRVQSFVYWIGTYLTIVCTAGYTVFQRIKNSHSGNWQLPYGPLSIANISSSPNYEFVWVYQNISIASIAMHFTTIDLLMAAMLAHISYQFKILQNNLRRIVANACKEMNSPLSKHEAPAKNKDMESTVQASQIPWSYLLKSLKQAIRYHVAIMDIAKEMELVFSYLLMLCFLGTLVILCFLIYRSSVIQNHVVILRYLGEAASVCFQVLTICFWGEQIVLESQRVGTAAYDANFIGTDLRFQRGLALIIRRSQTPTKLTAGKFADICLTTFTWVMRTSYSSFMVLRSNNQDL